MIDVSDIAAKMHALNVAAMVGRVLEVSDVHPQKTA